MVHAAVIGTALAAGSMRKKMGYRGAAQRT